MLDAYAAGVNAGLDALRKTPWEYLVLRTSPQPWRPEDSLLCVYAMWFDLQDSTGSFELSRQALRDALGPAALDFLAPRGDSWDAPLDDSRFPEPALPPFRFNAPTAEEKSALGDNPAGGAGRHPTGSNAFAIARRPHCQRRGAPCRMTPCTSACRSRTSGIAQSCNGPTGADRTGSPG